MRKHLVLVGGGHAHLTTLLNLADFVKRGHKATLVSSSSHHYYSGMGPGMLSGIYRPPEVRFHIRKMAEDRGASFVEDSVIAVDPLNRILRLAGGGHIEYDVASFNTGSGVPAEIADPSYDHVVTVKPIINLLHLRHRILGMPRDRGLGIVVIGGGPAGVEVAANLWRLAHADERSIRITLVAGNQVLAGQPPRVRRFAMQSLAERGVQITEKTRVEELSRSEIGLSDGRGLPYDFAVLAIGVRPSAIFRDSGLPIGQDEGLLVNESLQSVAHPEIFGGGDAVSMAGHELARVGVHATRQNPVLCHNLMAALEGGRMKAFNPNPGYLLILNMGNGTGILWKKGWVWNGRLSFALKDYIDRRFMRRFQVSGELDEPL
jgi:NADH dehydrogenase FAD-containing subunit